MTPKFGKFLCYARVALFVCSFGVTGVTSAYMLAYQGSNRCQWYDRGHVLVGSKDCLDELPVLDVDDHLNHILQITQEVSSEYNALEREFEYTPSQLLITPDTQKRLDAEFDNLINAPQTVISIPKILVAYSTRDRFKYVASTRDISGYGPCRKQNYHVAMNELDGVVLEPQETLNMNTLIANKPGYCTGGGEYRFFSGVCGGSTQLFWNAVLHPGLEVVERHAHGKRYAGFYGSTVMGDDSSIYERSKRLIIQNITESPIGFGTFERERDANTVLVSAWESEQDREVLIQKEQHGPRKALLRSTIYDGTSILQKDDRTSTYYGIDTSIDETANNR